MVILPTMTNTFITKLTDKNRRISIPKDNWDSEGLEVGDYIEVNIKIIRKKE